MGNIYSVSQACLNVGLNVVITNQKNAINEADAIIIPGVGAFGQAIENLHNLGLYKPILKSVDNGKPLFGICLGMQLLLESSEEFGFSNGFGLIKGRVLRIPSKIGDSEIKVPNVGWLKIQQKDEYNDSPLRHLDNSDRMYFVHSYFADVQSKSDVLTTSQKDKFEFCSSIKKDNIFAVQFHPEKSGMHGIETYRNWAKLNKLI